MKKLIMSLIAMLGLSSLHESKATVLYSENFEGTDVVAGSPTAFGNYNLDNTGWGWGVTFLNAAGQYAGNYFPAGGPNKVLYGVRDDQSGPNQGQKIITFAGDYGVPANVAAGKSQTTTFYYKFGNVTQSMVDQGYASLALDYKAMSSQDYGFASPSTGRFFIEVLGYQNNWGPQGEDWGYWTPALGASTSFSLLDSQNWSENVNLNVALDSSMVGKVLQFGVDLTSRGVGPNSDFSTTTIGVDNIVFQTASAPIPEPSVASLLGFGVLGLVATRFRRRS